MKIPAHKLALPLERLPTEKALRREILDEYFGDLLVPIGES